MQLQGLAHHLGRQARLQFLQALDRVVAVLDLRLVLVLERLFGELLLELRAFEAALQLVALFFDRADRLGDRELLRHLDGVELGLQVLDLHVFFRGALLQFAQVPCLSERGGGQLFLPGLLEFVGERVALFFDGAQGLAHRELARDLAGF
ncbi:hypothetical protein D9M72_565660 [compost metagenome]